MVFCPEQLFVFAPNQKQTFFFSQAKEHAIPPHTHTLPITPFFCEFCEDFTFYSLLNKLFFISFCGTIFFFKKNLAPPPTRIIWSAPKV